MGALINIKPMSNRCCPTTYARGRRPRWTKWTKVSANIDGVTLADLARFFCKVLPRAKCRASTHPARSRVRPSMGEDFGMRRISASLKKGGGEFPAANQR